ncbi:MAG: hypothetical protein ACREGL_10225 [Alphaproteobacteria bacterium]
MPDIVLPIGVMVATLLVLVGTLLAFRVWLKRRDVALERYMAEAGQVRAADPAPPSRVVHVRERHPA